MTTTYSFVGRQTNIQASSTCPGGTGNSVISMSRSYNVLGQLMTTVDANSKPTNYWTEPLGHVVAITDVESNITQATYNPLGHRLQSIDPDQGTWNFTYDALSELATQTDARGVVKKINARDALGRVTEQQEVPPANAPNGLTDDVRRRLDL